MPLTILQLPFTPELRKQIHDSLGKHAIASTGIDGLAQAPVCLQLNQEGSVLGWLVIQLFWGQLHIKNLVIQERERSKGYGTLLMNQAFEYGITHGCTFAFVETMSFQAPRFYEKLGFTIDFVRHGYAQGTSFYYLCKKL